MLAMSVSSERRPSADASASVAIMTSLYASGQTTADEIRPSAIAVYDQSKLICAVSYGRGDTTHGRDRARTTVGPDIAVVRDASAAEPERGVSAFALCSTPRLDANRARTGDRLNRCAREER